MLVEIPYGQGKIKVDIPAPFQILFPKKIKIKNEKKLIENALKNPIESVSFTDFIEKSKRILVIVNDATRPTPSSKILNYLLPVFSSHPDVKFLIATGSHRTPTDDEYKSIFGTTYEMFRKNIFAHDARKKEDLCYIGKSKKGTEIYINKLVCEYKNILVIGSVEPHYFAGYSGGRKSFLPGVSSYKTIEMNHKLALSENSKSLALKKNPVNQDMVNVVNLLKNLNIFSIQTVLTADHKIYAVTAGDIHKSFDEAVKYANEIYCVCLKQKGNIVISAATYPTDINLYQSQKALDNGKHALEDGGILILVSKCCNGIGDSTFLDLLGRAKSPKKIFDIIEKEYKLGYHKAAKIVQIGMKSQMWAVTDLENETIRKAHLKPYSSIQSAVNDAVFEIKKKGKKPRIIIMPAGSLTLPTI